MAMKSSTLLIGLLIGAIGLPAGFASAGQNGSANATNPKATAQRTADATAAQKKQQAALKRKKQQRAQAAAQAPKAEQLKAQQQAKKKQWYEKDRDRGLDVAAKYAPDTIARIRERQYVAKGDTVRTGNGKKGWQPYMDKYYSR